MRCNPPQNIFRRIIWPISSPPRLGTLEMKPRATMKPWDSAAAHAIRSGDQAARAPPSISLRAIPMFRGTGSATAARPHPKALSEGRTDLGERHRFGRGSCKTGAHGVRSPYPVVGFGALRLAIVRGTVPNPGVSGSITPLGQAQANAPATSTISSRPNADRLTHPSSCAS